MSNRPNPDQPAVGENDRTIVDKPTESNLENDATIKDSPNPAEFAATIKGAAAGGSLPSRSKTELSAGSRFGRYEVKKELGRGAMGAVYLALDVQLDREVAIKIPTFGPEDGPEEVERFYREARAMATLSHPNLCPVYDVGEIDGVHYLTMQFVEGRPMDDFLKGGKSHPAKQVAAVMRKLAVALEEAHQAGVIHRDLKPANIMLDKRNEPIIMDFGLAQRRKENETTLTHAGQIMGTPSYMSPEQVKGKQDIIGPPSDVYALGVICYQLLTGKLPFTGSLGEVMAAILTEEPDKPSKLNRKVDRSIEAICLKAMAKDMGQRYASAADLAKSLRDYLRGKRLPEEDAKLALPADASAEPTASVNTTVKEVALANDFFADLVVLENGWAQLFDGPTPATSPLGFSPPAQLTPVGRTTARRKVGGSRRVPNWVWIASGSGAGTLLLLIIIMAIASNTGSDGDDQRAAKAGRDAGNVSEDGKTHKPVAKTLKPVSELTTPPVVAPQPGSTLSDDSGSNPKSDSGRVDVGFPQGYFYMTTKSGEGQGLVLESDPLTLKLRANSSGMAWKAVPWPPDWVGYFILTSEALEEPNLVVEGTDGKGPALMVERRATGTWWKAVPAGEGYYYLTNAFWENRGKVLDGNVGEPQGADARFQGKPFMVEKESAGPSALWKFIPVSPREVN